MTLRELAQPLGVSFKTVHEWIRRGMPQHDLVAARDWLKANRRPPGRPKRVGPKLETALISEKGDGQVLDPLRKARLEQIRLECAILRLELAQRQGELIPVEEAEKRIRDVILPMRQILWSLPASQAARCNPSHPQLAREVLDGWVALAIRASRERRFTITDQGAEGVIGAAGPVGLESPGGPTAVGGIDVG